MRLRHGLAHDGQILYAAVTDGLYRQNQAGSRYFVGGYGVTEENEPLGLTWVDSTGAFGSVPVGNSVHMVASVGGLNLEGLALYRLDRDTEVAARVGDANPYSPRSQFAPGYIAWDGRPCICHRVRPMLAHFR